MRSFATPKNWTCILQWAGHYFYKENKKTGVKFTPVLKDQMRF